MSPGGEIVPDVCINCFAHKVVYFMDCDYAIFFIETFDKILPYLYVGNCSLFRLLILEIYFLFFMLHSIGVFLFLVPFGNLIQAFHFALFDFMYFLLISVFISIICIHVCVNLFNLQNVRIGIVNSFRALCVLKKAIIVNFIFQIILFIDSVKNFVMMKKNI